MTGYGCGVGAWTFTQVLCLPDVARFCSSGKAHIAQLEGDGQCGVVAVEKADGFGTALERLGPDFDGTYFGDPIPTACPGNPGRLAITSRLVRMADVSGFICERSLPASNGAASRAHRLMWVRFSSSVSFPLPTSSMSDRSSGRGPHT